MYESIIQQCMNLEVAMVLYLIIVMIFKISSFAFYKLKLKLDITSDILLIHMYAQSI